MSSSFTISGLLHQTRPWKESVSASDSVDTRFPKMSFVAGSFGAKIFSNINTRIWWTIGLSTIIVGQNLSW